MKKTISINYGKWTENQAGKEHGLIKQKNEKIHKQKQERQKREINLRKEGESEGWRKIKLKIYKKRKSRN